MNINPEIKVLKVEDIKNCPVNPRGIEEENLNGLKSSLKEFGYIDLLVVNKRNMEIVSGHQRFKCFMSEGVKEIPCIMIDVDESKQQAAMVTLNNKNIQGYWTEKIDDIIFKIKKDMPDQFINLKIEKIKKEIKQKEIILEDIRFSDASEEKSKMVITFLSKDKNLILKELQKIKKQFEGTEYYE